MDPALFGLTAALSWGTADLCARFTTRRFGAPLALLAVMVGGLAGLAALVAAGPGWPKAPDWVDAVNGVSSGLAMLLFYEALRRGPLAVAVPIVGAYPAWGLAWAVAHGAQPSAPTWAATAATMLGVWIVARAEPADPTTQPAPPSRVVPLALAASVVFALALAVGQMAAARHGALGALFHARWSGTAIVAAAVLWKRPRLTAAAWRWTPLLLVQAALDTGGLAAVYAIPPGGAGAVAIVASSCFGVVTVLLARLLLAEPISARQWLGIGLVFAGVAGLALAA